MSTGADWAGGAARLLVVCTANQCRSPMGEVLFRRALAARGVPAVVASAGSMRGGVVASAGSVRAMARRELDLSAHRSHQLDVAEVAGADLIVCMGRRHAREVVVLHPPAWPRTFTLRELVRRGSLVGPRHPGQTLAGWLDVVGDGRSRSALLADDPTDDIADPIGGPESAYEATAVLLDDLVDRAVALAFPAAAGPTGPAAAD